MSATGMSPTCVLSVFGRICIWEGDLERCGGISFFSTPSLHYSFFLSSWKTSYHLPSFIAPFWLPTNLPFATHLQGFLKVISLILQISPPGTQSSLHHSSPLHFIFTEPLWSRVVWELPSHPKPPSQLPQQYRNLNLCLIYPSMKPNHHTTLAFGGGVIYFQY